MFEQLDDWRGRKLSRFAVFSIAAHGVIVLGVALLAVWSARAPAEKVVDVTFIGPGKAPGAPPPPPPPGGTKPKHRKQPVHKVEIPKVIETPKPVVVKEPPPKEEDEVVEGGKEGGVVGGVIGGVVGGTVGSTGGGGTAPPPPPEPVKPKNVPAFVIKRDELNRPDPRMPEVFKLSHRGQTMTGSYRICVGLDGHVYDVIPVAAIAGADEAMIDQIKADWLYKPQRSPVCFLYNTSITIQ